MCRAFVFVAKELSVDSLAAKLDRLIEDAIASPVHVVTSRQKGNAELRAESGWIAINETLRAMSVLVIRASIAGVWWKALTTSLASWTGSEVSVIDVVPREIKVGIGSQWSSGQTLHHYY